MMIRKFYYGDIPEDSGPGGGSASPGAASTPGSTSASANAGSTTASGSANAGAASTIASESATAETKSNKDWPLWEVFIRSRQGLDHKHVGSLHAADAQMAIENARDVYTRRMEGVSIWVVESSHIHASNPEDAESFYEPANDKIYRHPTFYQLPDELSHM